MGGTESLGNLGAFAPFSGKTALSLLAEETGFLDTCAAQGGNLEATMETPLNH